MKIRYLSMLGIVATALAVTSVQAAETVIGGGDAQSCYWAAENGTATRSNIAVCDRALSSLLAGGDRAATFINRGILKLVNLDATGSLADFNRGLSMRDDMAEGYVDRGASLILMRRYDEALTNINKGISMDAKKPQIAYFDRGMANEGLGNIQAAYADYKQAQLIDPTFDEPTQELKRFKVRVVDKPAGT